MTEKPYDYYARWWNEQQRHHVRFKAYVKAHGVTCQSCGGRGESRGSGWYDPPEPCGWCETTGLMTKRDRGHYLTYMRSLKPRKKKVA
jgi:DnaJ-class molecular chaperone